MISINSNATARWSIFSPSLEAQAHSAFGGKEVFCEIKKVIYLNNYHLMIRWNVCLQREAILNKEGRQCTKAIDYLTQTARQKYPKREMVWRTILWIADAH